MSDYPATPELDKQHKIIEAGGPGAIGEFLDWLDGQDIFLACYSGYGSDLVHYQRRNRLRLIADFYGIDLDKVEAERLAVLEHVRAENEKKERE